MSFWMKLFRKEDVPEIQKLEGELASIQKKSDAEFLILVGLTGKLKGFDILIVKDSRRSTFQDRQLKSFAAKGAEFVTRFKALEFVPTEIEEPARVIKFYYNSNMQFYLFPLIENTGFMLMAYNCIAVRVLKEISKIIPILARIRPPDEEGE